MQLGVSVTKQLPEIPIYLRKATCSPGTVIPERGDAEIEIDYGFELAEDARNAIASGEGVLWFYVLITYRDIMDRTYEMGSCWQWGKRNKEDGLMYFFDDGSAPAAYTKRTEAKKIGLSCKVIPLASNPLAHVKKLTECFIRI
jgi:hypothetical protein